jgi:hypothetical protein
MSICSCRIAATILVLLVVVDIGSSCSMQRILFRKFSNLELSACNISARQLGLVMLGRLHLSVGIPPVVTLVHVGF